MFLRTFKPVLTLRANNSAHISLTSPHSLMVDRRVWAASPLVVALRCVFWFFCPVLVPSEIPKLPTDMPVRVSYYVETSPLSWLPPQSGSPSLILLCLFLSFIFCSTSFEKIGLPFSVPGVLCQNSEAVLWKFLDIKMIFWWICRGESGLPILFLHHIGTMLPSFVVVQSTLLDSCGTCEYDRLVLPVILLFYRFCLNRLEGEIKSKRSAVLLALKKNKLPHCIEDPMTEPGIASRSWEWLCLASSSRIWPSRHPQVLVIENKHLL